MSSHDFLFVSMSWHAVQVVSCQWKIILISSHFNIDYKRLGLIFYSFTLSYILEMIYLCYRFSLDLCFYLFLSLLPAYAAVVIPPVKYIPQGWLLKLIRALSLLNLQCRLWAPWFTTLPSIAASYVMPANAFMTSLYERM